jgi:hypothetical protein
MIPQAIEDGILFKFVEDTLGGGFQNATNWGFVIQNKTDDPKASRWAKVTNVGPKVKYVQVGQYILIEKLMWTAGLRFLGDLFWKTNEKYVMCVSDVPPSF